MWYDKQGKPIKDHFAVEKLLRDFDYKVIKQQVTKDKKWVSTVWLGLDHRLGGDEDKEPLIFETMVFTKKGSGDEIDVERYATEDEAKAGHKVLFNKYNKDE